jgi:hypothetical protein
MPSKTKVATLKAATAEDLALVVNAYITEEITDPSKGRSMLGAPQFITLFNVGNERSMLGAFITYTESK